MQTSTKAALPLTATLRTLIPSSISYTRIGSLAALLLALAGNAFAQDAKLTLSPALIVTGATDRLAIESDGSFDLSKVTAAQISHQPGSRRARCENYRHRAEAGRHRAGPLQQRADRQAHRQRQGRRQGWQGRTRHHPGRGAGRQRASSRLQNRVSRRRARPSPRWHCVAQAATSRSRLDCFASLAMRRDPACRRHFTFRQIGGRARDRIEQRPVALLHHVALRERRARLLAERAHHPVVAVVAEQHHADERGERDAALLAQRVRRPRAALARRRSANAPPASARRSASARRTSSRSRSEALAGCRRRSGRRRRPARHTLRSRE